MLCLWCWSRPGLLQDGPAWSRKWRRRADDRQEFFNGPPRHKRMRTDFERNQAFGRPEGPRGGRYSGVRRDTSFIDGGHGEQSYDNSYPTFNKSPGFSNSSHGFYGNKKQPYNDYMRDFAHIRQPPPPPMAPYGPPPPGYYEPPPNSYTSYDRSRDYMPGPDYNSPQNSSRSRSDSKRSYERDVDDFLRRTTHGVTSRTRDRERDHDRDRDREHRDRERERDRDRDHDRDRHRHRDRR